jgi:hypothetical protein
LTRAFSSGPPQAGQASRVTETSTGSSGDRLGRRRFSEAGRPRAGLPSRALRCGLACAFGKGGSLPIPTPLELFDLGAQRLMAGGQLGQLPLQLSHPREQFFPIQGCKGFRRNHSLNYRPLAWRPQDGPLINYVQAMKKDHAMSLWFSASGTFLSFSSIGPYAHFLAIQRHNIDLV